MPLDTMASALDLISTSLTLQPNVFHEFQPMGGVAARIPGTGAGALAASRLPPASGLPPSAGPALSPPFATARPPGTAAPPSVPTGEGLTPVSSLRISG